MRLLTLALLLLPVVAFADAVRVSVDARTEFGKADPKLKIAILEPIAGYEVTLKRSDGVGMGVRGGGKPGVTRAISLPQPEGKFRYQGTLTVNLPDGATASMPLDFETESWGPLKLTVDTTLEDVKERRARFRLNRPIAKVHLTVVMDTGETVVDSDVLFNGEAPGTPLEVTWPEAKGRVMKIGLVAWDTSTFFAGVETWPWQVEIPHEEVTFDSGVAKVRKDQEPKIDESYAQIAEEVRRYGKLAPLRLYVAGHTDTVGPNDKNRALSLQRARSLAAAFRKRGLRLPIYYEGFGEEALRVGTPDDTAEESNRRAEYIIAVEHPRIQGSGRTPAWKKL